MTTGTTDEIGSGWSVPAIEPMSSASRRLMALIRIAVGVMWLTNLNWKTPPDFGQNGGGGLYGYVRDAVDHPVFGPFAWAARHVVLPHFGQFGWLVLVVEASLAAFLLLGLGTRFWGLAGALQATTIGLSVALTPGEWPWSYWLMIMANLSLWATVAGRTWGLDGIVRPLFAGGTTRWARLVEKVT